MVPDFISLGVFTDDESFAGGRLLLWGSAVSMRAAAPPGDVVSLRVVSPGELCPCRRVGD